jgi:hypothetical protein
MMPKTGEHAVVLSASMSGLLAARVLADAYQRVTVIDRDPLPEDEADQKGVPQGHHAHALLPRGAQILYELFPGMLAGLAAAEVPVLDHPGSCGSRPAGTCCAATVNLPTRSTSRAGPSSKARSAAGSGRCPTCRSRTGARWPGWPPPEPGTGSPAPGCGPAAARQSRSWPPPRSSTPPAAAGGPGVAQGDGV